MIDGIDGSAIVSWSCAEDKADEEEEEEGPFACSTLDTDEEWNFMPD